jgi:Tol biopolymer transport system component
MVRRCLLAVLLLVGSFGLTGAESTLAAAPAELISVDPKTGGAQAGDDEGPSVSGDGNIVVFTDTDIKSPAFVYVRDRARGITSAVPLPRGVVSTEGGVVSRDGCHVVYWGFLSSAVAASGWIVYRWDRCLAGSAPVAVSKLSTDSLAYFGGLTISADGRFIAYAAPPRASQLVWVDTATAQQSAFNQTFDFANVDMSDDGKFVAVGGDPTGAGGSSVVVGWTPPCVVGDPGTCNTEVLSVAPDGSTASGFSNDPSVSSDGRYVAFSSNAPEIVGLPAGLPSQLYVRDRVGGVTKLVTDSPGQPMSGGLAVFEPDISPDGTQVAHSQFRSTGDGGISETWVARSSSGLFDTSSFDLVSYGLSGAPVTTGAQSPSMSSNGRFVAFVSYATDELAPGTLPVGSNDIWMRERPAKLSATPTLDFGIVDIGGQSAPQNAVVTNTGLITVNIATVTPPAAPFSITANGCAGVLQPGASCNVTLVFRPTAAGPANSAVTVLGDGLAVSSALVGVGRVVPTAGSLTVTPATADFGSGIVVASLGAKNFVVSNPGQTPVTISSVGLSGTGADQFAVGPNGCTGALAAGASCTVTVSSTVTRVGVFTATLNIVGSGGQSAQVSLQARGTAKGSVAPTPTTTTAPAPPGVFNPVLKMNPGVVAPGGVTLAIGSEFPPDIDVLLAFAGETPFGSAHTDAVGAFRFTLLVLADGTHLGGRNVVAIDQAQFSGVRAPLLIDVGTLRPSGAGSPATPNGLPSLLIRGG